MTVYAKAADIIRRRGWHQGGYEAPDGSVCLLGALGHAREGHSQYWAGEDVEAIEPHIGTENVGDWNDAPERTVEDIFLLLKELHVEAGGS